MKKVFVKSGLVLAAAACLMAGCVYAEDAPEKEKEIVSENGAIDISLPTEEWKEVKYDGACVAFSDGDDMILFNHFAKDEPVKNVEPGEGDELYCESIETTKNEKLVFYGYADKKEDLDQIKVAIAKAKVDPDKLPEEKHEIVEDQYSIEANEFTGYITANEVNVRSEKGMDADPIGTLYRADEVHVTGNVLKNGSSCGWYQIDFNGGKGYVSAEFISTNKPEPQPQPQPDLPPVVNVGITRADGTDEGTHFVHKEGDGWVDDHGDSFTGHDDGVTWTRNTDGTLWTSEEHPQPESEIKPVLNISITRADGTDEGTHFVHEEGGGWVDDHGDAFTDNGDNTWTRTTDGTLWQ